MALRKYRNKPVTISGMRFDSKAEGGRYSELALLERAGEIRDLRCQVSFTIPVCGVVICRYVADFVYDQLSGDEWRTVVEDVKGVETAVFKLKRKLMKAVHGIDIVTVRR